MHYSKNDNLRSDGYPDSWYVETANETADYPDVEQDITCDVCIIGGGFTGVSAALELAKKGVDVVLLEAEKIGWGASGRNGGQVGLGQRMDQDEIEKKYGLEAAHDFWNMSLEALDLVKSLVAEYDIKCDMTAGVLHAAAKVSHTEGLKNYQEYLKTTYGYDKFKYYGKEELAELIGTDLYFGGKLGLETVHLHPLNFTLGVARAASEKGARIYHNAAVEKIKSGNPLTLHLKNAQVKAKKLLLCCNGYLGDLNGKAAKKILPINNYIVTTEPLGEERARKINKENIAVADSFFVLNYFRMTSDHRLLFGGGESYSSTFPKDIKSYVRPHLLRVYPELEDVKIDYGWGGVLAVTLNRLPHFAYLEPNILVAQGFSGHGVGAATYAGKLMAEEVHSGSTGFKAFEKLNIPSFPGGVLLRKPAMVAGMLYYGLRDKL